MWKNSHPSAANEPKGRGPRRLLIAGLLLALVLGGVGQVRAAPASIVQASTLTVAPGSLTLCKGQTGTVKVTARLLTIRIPGSRPSKQAPRSTNVLTAESSSASASVSPAQDELTFRSQGTMSFGVRGNSVGDGVLTFRLNPPGADVVAPLVGPAPAQPGSASNSATMVVHVRECTYTLILRSAWTIPKGWVYRLTSSLVSEIVPAQDGTFSDTPLVRNTHQQLIPIPGPCSKTPRIENTRAHVQGTLDDRGWLDFKVSYDSVHEATTTIACRTPIGTIGAQAQGTGQAAAYDPQPIPVLALAALPGRAVGGSYPQELHSDLGTAQGFGVYVIVTHVVSP